MDSFLRKVCEKKGDDSSHKHFIRFGKGNYRRRFILSYNKGEKIKIKGSFEWANDFVNFVKENKDLKYTGKVLSKEQLPGMNSKKKAGVFVYEIEESGIKEFENAYFYLLDANDSDITLKIKKALPKPGKDAEKIDDKFCVLEVNMKYWNEIKDKFFWDVPECKKAMVENELVFTDIEIPKNEKDPVKMRENALRKGKIIRKMNCDGKEFVKEYSVEA